MMATHRVGWTGRRTAAVSASTRGSAAFGGSDRYHDDCTGEDES